MNRNTYWHTRLLQRDMLLRDYQHAIECPDAGDSAREIEAVLAGIARVGDGTCPRCREPFDESALASINGCCDDCAVTTVMRAMAPA